MNAVELILSRIEEHPRRTALWLPPNRTATFGELGDIAARTRARMVRAGVGAGDTVLLFEPLGPALYGAVIGITSLGASVALVEPWMPVDRINHVIPFVKPKAFLTNWMGRAWGMRVAAIRAIPHWIRAAEIRRESPLHAPVVPVDPESPAIITFTSGTTGRPKGMVRTHRYLVDQHRILSASLHADSHGGSDLCIFANFVLSNLASGRPSVIIPPKWSADDFALLDVLPRDLRPQTLTCGPGFLLRLMDFCRLPMLRSIHVGGALTDCAIFERGFAKWPEADWRHLYGSTEVEPVAVADARLAVRRSRERGYFQTLFLGSPIAEIRSELTADTLWVTGPHVCPRYLANDEENRKYKRTDADGAVWHRMGDRILADESGWWYGGRESQPLEDFLAEQRLYSLISSSAAFLERAEEGGYRAFVQGAKERESLIRTSFPQVSRVIPVIITRDRRHRARIDRVASQRKAVWDAG